VSFVDIAGADALANESAQRQAEGGGLYLINVKSGLWESLEECHALDRINPNHIFQSKSAALHGIFQKLDKEKCRHCTARTFTECATIEFANAPLPAPASPRQPEPLPQPALAPDAEPAGA
jgi:SulP family sulfate permease